MATAAGGQGEIEGHNASQRERAAALVTEGYAGLDHRPHPRARAHASWAAASTPTAAAGWSRSGPVPPTSACPGPTSACCAARGSSWSAARTSRSTWSSARSRCRAARSSRTGSPSPAPTSPSARHRSAPCPPAPPGRSTPTASARGATAAAPAPSPPCCWSWPACSTSSARSSPPSPITSSGSRSWCPFHAHHVAGVLGILAGVALIGLSFPVLRGYRPAYLATLAVLGVSIVSMLTHSAHVFQVVPRHRRAALAAGQAGPVPGHARRPQPLGGVGLHPRPRCRGLRRPSSSPPSTATSSSPATASPSPAACSSCSASSPPDPDAGSPSRAPSGPRRSSRPAVIARHGGDTLDYFALRDDKELLFSGDGLVAYTVLDRTMLISPDPICAPEQRASVMIDAVELADRNGWDVSVLAANASWLPIYHALGMHEIYMGDEAILDCSDFTLNGRAMKSLRGTWNRVHKLGYRVEMLDPAAIEPAMQAALTELMTETRQGDAERGFSMTLSRIFDPRDTGPAARRVPRPRRHAGRVQPVRARPRHRRLVARPHAPHQRPRRPQRPHRLRRHRDGPVDAGAGPAGPVPQLRGDAGGARRRAGRRAVAQGRAEDDAPLQRVDADRVAVEVQREVRPRLAAPLRRHRRRGRAGPGRHRHRPGRVRRRAPRGRPPAQAAEGPPDRPDAPSSADDGLVAAGEQTA